MVDRHRELKETPRSPHWPAVRETHLRAQPRCAVCGGDKHLQVHHIQPFHLHPELELDLTNLLTLCEPSDVLGCNCHLVFGHFGDWQTFDPDVVANAARLLPQIAKQRDLKQVPTEMAACASPPSLNSQP